MRWARRSSGSCSDRYEVKEQILGAEAMRYHERIVMLSVLDGLWKDHLLAMDHLKEGIGLRGYAQQDPLVAYKKESFEMFEAMMLRFQEDTARHLFRMQIIGPDGTPIETAEQMQAGAAGDCGPAAGAWRHTQQALAAQQQAQAALAAEAMRVQQGQPQIQPPQRRPAEQQARLPLNGAEPAQAPKPAVPVPMRPPSTTIDKLEREFQQKKQRELDQARSAGASDTSANGGAPRRAGEKVGRNDDCPCGSGKKYKKCHGAQA